MLGHMKNELRRTQHAELALHLASRDQRLMDSISQRPYLLNPYPSIVARLSRRSRRFRQKLGGVELGQALVSSPLGWIPSAAIGR
jgi:hypothetical protein